MTLEEMVSKMETRMQELDWAMAEIERLQRHVDLAFDCACVGDASGARRHLTDARWGRSTHHTSAGPGGDRAAIDDAGLPSPEQSGRRPR